MSKKVKLKLDEEKGSAFVCLDNVRLSYPYLNDPRPKKKGEEDRKDKWEASFIIDHTMGSPFKTNFGNLKKAIDFVRAQVFKSRKVVAMVHPNTKKEGTPGYEDEKGYYICAPSYGRKPTIQDNRKVTRDDAPDSLFYPGARVNAVIRVYGQIKKGEGTQNRVACSLEAIQFLDHDTRIDSVSSVDTDEWFEVHDVSDDDEDGEEADYEEEEEGSWV